MLYDASCYCNVWILDLGCAAEPDPQEVAFFDVYPPNNNRRFSGSWSNYPFFESGTVVVSSIEQGLFVLQPQLPCTDTVPPEAVAGTEDLHCVWPPNRREVCFGREDFAPEVSDDCGEVAWEFAGCESDQPAAAAHWFPGPPDDDCRVEADRICVRATRDGCPDQVRYGFWLNAVTGEKRDDRGFQPSEGEA